MMPIPDGMTMQDTGGGCTAWGFDLADGHLLVTQEQDPCAPEELDAPCMLGVYDGGSPNGDCFVLIRVPSTATFLAAWDQEPVCDLCTLCSKAATHMLQGDNEAALAVAQAIAALLGGTVDGGVR